jgi:tetratricopeptide (TPR) repeat protein
MDARFGPTSNSLLLRGHVLDNLHHFKGAEAVARELVQKQPDAYAYALLSDALMEQGKLPAAVSACQEEMNRRPGLESYARAAHLRWLTGDLKGATEMMEMAVHASSPVDPANCAWVVTRLSGYVLQGGQAEQALKLAQSADRVAGDYPPALLAEGRALLALGRTGEAASILSRAAELNPLPEYEWWQADALRAAGQPDAADKAEAALVSTGPADDPRTFALFAATRVEERRGPAAWARTALGCAQAELQNRADPLTQDALAWAKFASGDTPGAAAAMRAALADGTRDARLLLHAGLIAQADGDPAAARADFTGAAPFAATLTPGESALLHRQPSRSSLASADRR